MQTKKGYCEDCEENKKLERKGINHILHIILTFFTLSAWGLVYGALIVLHTGGWGWRCSDCGSDEVKDKPPKKPKKD